jgi:RHH-type rel operon transcriptional repressor/antitoxin RelB
MPAKPAKGAIVSVRLDPKQRKRLDALAQVTERSNSFLAAEAIENYLDLQEWQVRGIKEGLRSLDEGRWVDHEQVRALMRKAEAKARSKG